MLSLAAIKARLIAQVPDFKRVHGAADFSAALERGQLGADAWLVMLETRAERNQLISGGTSQRVTARFAVLEWVTAANDPSGDAALDLLESKRQKVLDALVGWAPAAGFNPIEYDGGRLIKFVPPGVLWTDEFRIQFLQRNIQ
jgi:hypothetical protein